MKPLTLDAAKRKIATLEKKHIHYDSIIAHLNEVIAVREASIGTLHALLDVAQAPIPARLQCPSCGKLHIDKGEFATKPHHTHACQFCGMTWRPAVVHTIGVQFLPGFLDPAPDAPETLLKMVAAGELSVDALRARLGLGIVSTVHKAQGMTWEILGDG